MLPLLFALVIFFFLVVGAVLFLACVAMRPLRRYALSAALWCAAWGPCSVALMFLAGLAFVAQALIPQIGAIERLHAPHLPKALGWGYVVLGTVGTATVATGLAWLHQVVARRITFALFRLYATVVSAGIGSIFGWCFGWWLLTREVRYAWVLWGAAILILVTGFGITAYKGARSLRGTAPRTWAWVSKEEFEGA